MLRFLIDFPTLPFPKVACQFMIPPALTKMPDTQVEDRFSILASTVDTSIVDVSHVAQQWGGLKTGSQGTWA